jgi:hypothetical protein
LAGLAVVPAAPEAAPANSACPWRVVTRTRVSGECYFVNDPEDSPPCYDSLMRNFAVLFIHFIALLARLLGPGGVRSLVAESLLLKHQILILNRSRKRSPNLHASDRILAGLLALLRLARTSRLQSLRLNVGGGLIAACSCWAAVTLYFFRAIRCPPGSR